MFLLCKTILTEIFYIFVCCRFFGEINDVSKTKKYLSWHPYNHNRYFLKREIWLDVFMTQWSKPELSCPCHLEKSKQKLKMEIVHKVYPNLNISFLNSWMMYRLLFDLEMYVPFWRKIWMFHTMIRCYSMFLYLNVIYDYYA